MNGMDPFIKGEFTMTVKELIEKLSSLDSDSQVLVRFLNSDDYGVFQRS